SYGDGTAGAPPAASRAPSRRASEAKPLMSVPPCGPHHLVGVALERPPVEAAPHLPARESRRAQQQLHLEAERPAQGEAVAAHIPHRAAFIVELHLALGAQRLADPVVAGRVPQHDRSAGFRVAELALADPPAVALGDDGEAGVE